MRLRRSPLWGPFATRDFRLFWAGESVSVLGDQFYFVALPWLTLQLAGSPLALGTVLMASEIPRALLLLFGGAIVDRTGPRILMLASNALRALLVGLLAVLVLTGRAQLWELYALSFLFGSIGALFYPAFDSFTPALLPEERLGAGNAVIQGSAQIAGLLGPVAAGVVIAVLGRRGGNGGAFAVDAGSFAIATMTLLLMRGTTGRRGGSREEESQSPDDGTGMLASIKEGLQAAWQDPVLRALLLVLLTVGLAINGPLDIGLPALARARYGSAAAFGVLIAAFGLGALSGTILAGTLSSFRHRGPTLIGLCALFGIGTPLIALAPDIPVASLLLVVLGVGTGFIGVAITTWIQTRAAPHMLGRMMSMFALAGVGLVPVSLAISGVIAQFDLSLLFDAGGAAMGLVALGMAASPTIRKFD